MKRLFSITMTLLFVVGAMAQTETFDITSFTAPKGYKKELKGSAVAFTITSSETKGWCIINVYQSVDSKGSSMDDFNNEWKEMVTKKFEQADSPQTNTQVAEDGWTVTSGAAKIEINNENAVALLTTITGYSKCVSIIALTNRQTYLNDIEALMGTLDMKVPAVNAKNKPISTSPVPVTSNTKAEVWMNAQFKPVNSGGSYSDLPAGTVKAEFYLVYPNGDYYPHFPVEGLLTFDRTKSKSSEEGVSWGKFTMHGNKGSFVSKYENIKVEKKSSTEMIKTGYAFRFKKCMPVDGLKLDGAWSYIASWRSDPYYTQAGCRQVIYFSRNGSFDDRGIFVSNCLYPNKDPRDAPGKGTYHINNFTLVLNYDDGRVIYKAFTGVGGVDPFTKNEVIYIGTNAFFSK